MSLFKVGMKVQYGPQITPFEEGGYDWVKRFLGSNPVTIKAISEEDGRGKLEFEEDVGHLYPDIAFTICEY